MASDKLTLNLTGDQQKQIKDATGRTVAQLNLDLTSSELSEQNLAKVAGGLNPVDGVIDPKPYNPVDG